MILKITNWKIKAI